MGFLPKLSESGPKISYASMDKATMDIKEAIKATNSNLKC